MSGHTPWSLIKHRRSGMVALATAIQLQAAFIMGWTKARTPGRVRARRELREHREANAILEKRCLDLWGAKCSEFDMAKAMMLSYEDLLAAAYKQRDEAKEHLADLQEEINELREDNRELDRELGRWQDAAWDASHGH